MRFCADAIMCLYQLSRCCQYRSRWKQLHLGLNNTHDCQCGRHVALIILLMQHEKLFTLHRHSSSGCSRECVAVHFNDDGSQHITHRHQRDKVYIFHSTVEYRTVARSRNSQKWELQILTGRAYPTLGKPLGSMVQVPVWPAKRKWVWFLGGSRTQLNSLAGPNRDHWPVHQTSCQIQHTLCAAYPISWIITRLSIIRAQPNSHLAVGHVVLNSLLSCNYMLTN